MTNDNKENDEIVYLDARSQDVESLKTIVPRSFFAVNEKIRKLLPDTPAMRAWWGRVFEDYMANPNSHVPIAIDTSTNTVVGAIMLHGVRQGQPFGGFMADHPPTEDHDMEGWPTAIKGFAEREKSTVGDRDRFLVEVMGVDSAYQGKGIGKQLVANACGFADAKGWPIFLETSAARGFYLKQAVGFKVIAEDDEAKEAREGEEPHGGVLLREPAVSAK